jgi:Subtilase family/Fibronectin type-III domain
MILYNLPLADTETDNHFLPAVHLADGTAFLAFMAAHPTATASSTAGAKGVGQGDVMASFSSRGPGGLFLKPDITAPGVQILAGNTPVPDELASGPPGEYFQAIAGTSMSSPHIAGSAILLQALHPSWGPGAIKSALMTTANTNVVKEDGSTPADPFDDGSGRVDLTKAGATPVVFEDSALNMFDHGNDPLTAMNVNTPSVNVPTMPGVVTLTRTAKNVTNHSYSFHVSTTNPAGSTIRVSPSSGTIKPGKSKTFKITISSSAPTGQYFGQIKLQGSGKPALHLPVAFFNQQGDVTLTQSCAASSVKVGQTTLCTVKATNDSFEAAGVSADSTVSGPLKIVGATGATVHNQGRTASAGPVSLDGQKDAVPSIAPGVSPAGYLPLDLFGITPIPVGDEDILNFNVDDFVYGGKTYSEIGVDSNGYLVVGGGTSEDNNFEPQTFPDTARPNNVLAPFWTDLNGEGAPGILAGSLTDGVNSWTVLEWRVNVFGTTSQRVMQAWIGNNGVEDISFAYDPTDLPADPGQSFNVGVENSSGTAGDQIAGLPTEDLVVTSLPGEPGESLTYTLTVKGTKKGHGTLTTSMESDLVAGTTKVATQLAVTRH